MVQKIWSCNGVCEYELILPNGGPPIGYMIFLLCNVRTGNWLKMDQICTKVILQDEGVKVHTV